MFHPLIIVFFVIFMMVKWVSISKHAASLFHNSIIHPSKSKVIFFSNEMFSGNLRKSTVSLICDLSIPIVYSRILATDEQYFSIPFMKYFRDERNEFIWNEVSIAYWNPQIRRYMYVFGRNQQKTDSVFEKLKIYPLFIS